MAKNRKIYRIRTFDAHGQYLPKGDEDGTEWVVALDWRPVDQGKAKNPSQIKMKPLDYFTENPIAT